ncbi:MAG: hypothetical protein WKF30_14570 [Pyrinomonadaceae bacterium]
MALMKFEINRARLPYAEAEKGISLLEPDVRFTVLLAAGSRRYPQPDRASGLPVYQKRAHLTSAKLRRLPSIWHEAKGYKIRRNLYLHPLVFHQLASPAFK